jgi:transcriptional regulator with XRE-family HTH domain
MMAPQKLGGQVKAARSKSGLSLRKLAALAGIPATTIAGYEKGNKIPADNFLRIADALKHHTYEVGGNLFSVGRTHTARGVPLASEQLSLDFSGEYGYSFARVKIGPGKIIVSFDAVRSRRKAVSPKRVS